MGRVRQFIDTHEWHFAKTIPQIQHWYYLLMDKNDVEEFRWFAAHIREYSKPGQFYGKLTTITIWIIINTGGWILLLKSVTLSIAIK